MHQCIWPQPGVCLAGRKGWTAAKGDHPQGQAVRIFRCGIKKAEPLALGKRNGLDSHLGQAQSHFETGAFGSL